MATRKNEEACDKIAGIYKKYVQNVKHLEYSSSSPRRLHPNSLDSGEYKERLKEKELKRML